VSGDYDSALSSRYLAGLRREILDLGGAELQPAVDTIYFGGGTPSLLPADELCRLLDVLGEAFEIDTSAEITVEMNPGTIDTAKLGAYRARGVNRASVGVQSFDDAELAFLGRVHDAATAETAVAALRSAGFDNLSLDLIAGLPYQSIDRWRRSLEAAVGLEPDHLSLYLLELYPGTKLARDVESGKVMAPDEELAVEAYELMIDVLAEAGFEQYEISSFARTERHRSRHNLKYWTDAPYYGVGVSAHGYVRSTRTANVRSIARYVELMEGGKSPREYELELSPDERVAEALFMGMRCRAGIDLAKFRHEYGIDVMARYGDSLAESFETGLIELDSGNLRLTRRGLLLSNEVFRSFLDLPGRSAAAHEV
jgi:oxygen-independent coproporphyrinogen-3 oxidase